MARIGLVDVDGHNFPNLALMRISTYHKGMGDEVEWWIGNLIHYDIVYKSKVFSWSTDVDVWNADHIEQGGSGYAIQLVDGVEQYGDDKGLPDYIENLSPDYSIYPEYDFAIAMTSRGCPRGCHFCHVKAKEGGVSRKVADVDLFYKGQKKMQILDPNITACKDKRDLFRQYKETGAKLMFNQGLDIRLLNDDDIADLNEMKLESLHFAWDNPTDDLESKFKYFSENFTGKKRNLTEVFVLTNFEAGMTTDQHIERALRRIYPLRDMGYNPYVMIYNKPDAPREIKLLQRWCNNKYIFRSCAKFEDYDPRIG